MNQWKISDTEWHLLAHFLHGPYSGLTGPGRPRIDDTKNIAEACLYRHYHAGKTGYRTFGWNRLPKKFGVSPSTANRRYREWSKTGAWNRFWHGLLVLRGKADSQQTGDFLAPPTTDLDRPDASKSERPPRLESEPWIVDRTLNRFPIGDVVIELERAYLFFNAHFFGKALPADVGITIERRFGRACGGYYCGRVWRDGERRLGHIALMTETLGYGVETALQVLLHEMVHLRNDQHGIRDCHPRNQYHNRYFRDIAHLSGLKCAERDVAHGYASTSFNQDGLDAIVLFQAKEHLFRWNVF